MPIPNYHKPIPAGQKLRLLAYDTLEAIARNFKTQGIFPYEVYKGYMAENAKAKSSSWKSTGAGFDSFYFQLQDAARDSDIGVREARIDFFFDYYLKFVDMGVGKGRPIQKVKRTLSADHDIRYLAWNSQEGSTQRPAIMMEFRYQANRMMKYFATRYKYDAQAIVISGLEGITGEKRPEL